MAYSVIKRNEQLRTERTLKNPKCIWLSGKKQQPEKALYFRISTIWHLEKEIFGDNENSTGCLGMWGGKEKWIGGTTGYF